MRWFAVVFACAIPLGAGGEDLPDLYPYASDPLAEREQDNQAPRLFWEEAARQDKTGNGRVTLDTGETATFKLPAQGHLRLQSAGDQVAPPLLWLSRDGELWWQASWTPAAEGEEWLHVKDKPFPLLARLEAASGFRGRLLVATLDPVPSPSPYEEATLTRPRTQVALADEDGTWRDVQRLGQDEILELAVEGPRVLSVATRPAEAAAHQQQYALSWRLNEAAWLHTSIERTQLSTLYQEVGATRLHGGMDRRYLTVPEGEHRLALKASLPVLARIEQAEQAYLLDRNEPEPTTAALTQGLLDVPLAADGKTLEELDALRQSNHLDGAADISLGHLDQDATPFPGARPQAARQALAGDIERRQRFFRTLFPDLGDAPMAMNMAWFATTSPLELEPDEHYYLGEGLLERLGHGLFVELGDEPLVYPLPVRFGPSRLRLAVARLSAHPDAELWVQHDDAPAMRLRLTGPARGGALPTPEDAALSQGQAPGQAWGHPTLGGRFAAEREPGHYWPAAVVELPLPANVDEVRIWSDVALPIALQYRASQPFEAGESVYEELLEQTPGAAVSRLHQALEAVPNPDAQPLPLEPSPEQALENQWYPMLRYLHAAQAAYLDDVSARGPGPIPGNMNERLERAKARAQRADWIGVMEALGRTGYGQSAQAYRLSQQALEALGEHYLARRQRQSTAVFGQRAEARRLATDDLMAEYAATQRYDSQVWLLAARFLREGDGQLLEPLGEALHRAGDSLWATQLGLLLAQEGQPPAWLSEAAEEAGWLATADRADKDAARLVLRQGDRAARRGDSAQAMAHWAQAGETGQARIQRLREAQAIAAALESPDREHRLAGVERWLDWSLSSQQPFDWVSLANRLKGSGGFSTLFSEVTRTPLALPHASADTPVEVDVVGPALLRVQLRRVAPNTREAGELDWLSSELVDVTGTVKTLKAPILHRAENPYLQAVNRNTGIAAGEEVLIEVPAGLHRVRLRPRDHAYLAQLWQWQPTRLWAVLPPVTPLALEDLVRASSDRREFLSATVPDYVRVRDGELEPLSVMASARRYSRELAILGTANVKDALDTLDFPDRAVEPAHWPEGHRAVEVEAIGIDAGVPESPRAAHALAVALLWRLEQNPGDRDRVSARLAQLAEAHGESSPLRQLVDTLLQGYDWEHIGSSYESAGVRQLPLQARMHSPFRRVRQALLPEMPVSVMLLSGRGTEGVELFTPEPLEIEIRLAQRVLPHEARVPAEVMIQLDDRESRRIRLSERETVEHIRLEAGDHALRLWLSSPRQQQFVTARLGRAQGGAALLDDASRTFHIAAPGQPASFYVKGPAWVRVDEWPPRDGATRYRFVAPGWQSLTFEAADGEDRYYRLHALRPSPEAGAPLEPGETTASLAAPARGPSLPPEPEAPVAWTLNDYYPPGAGLNSWGGYLEAVERVEGSEDEVAPVQGASALEAGLSYRFRQQDRRLFSRSDVLLRRFETSQDVLGARQWVDFYPEDSDWLLGLFGEAYLQPGSIPGLDGNNHWAARLQGRVERTYHLSSRLRHEPGITVSQRWMSLDAVPSDVLPDIDPDIFSPYKDDHRRSLILSDRLTWSSYRDQRLYLEGALVSNASLNPFDPDYLEVTTAARQLFGSVVGEAGVRWRHYVDDGDRASSLDRERIFVGGHLLRFDGGANAITLRAETDYDIDRRDVGFGLRIGFEANEGRLSPARRPDEIEFLPLRRAQQRARVDTNRLDPVYP